MLQVDASWKPGSTCDSVWPGLACTCVDLTLTFVEIKFARKSKQAFHRLTTQPKSTQVDFLLVRLARALKWSWYNPSLVGRIWSWYSGSFGKRWGDVQETPMSSSVLYQLNSPGCGHEVIDNWPISVVSRKAWKNFGISSDVIVPMGEVLNLVVSDSRFDNLSCLPSTLDELLMLLSSNHLIWNHLLQKRFDSNTETEKVSVLAVGVLRQRPSACFSVWRIWIVSPTEPNSLTKTISKDEAAFPADNEPTRVYAAGDVFGWLYRYM